MLLKAAVRMRDTKLGAAEESAAEMKADLVESQQQVSQVVGGWWCGAQHV